MMVEQRRGHGPDQMIKQEHMHFITLIHQQTLSIQTTSLSLPFVYVFVSLSVLRWNSNLDHVKIMMRTQLPELVRRAAVATQTFSYQHLLSSVAMYTVQPSQSCQNASTRCSEGSSRWRALLVMVALMSYKQLVCA